MQMFTFRLMKYLVFSIFVIYTLGCKAPQLISDPTEILKLYPISENDVWGYNDEDGNLLIDLQFDKVNLFTNGLASVKLDGKYGFINKIGEFEIKPKYDTVYQMRQSYTNVIKNGKSFQINRKGKKLRGKNIKSGVIGHYGEALKATNPLEVFDKSNAGYILKPAYLEAQKRYEPQANHELKDFTFQEVIPFSHTTIIVKKEEKYGFFTHFNHVGLNNNWIDDIQLNHTIRGKQIVSTSRCMVKVDNKWGLVESMGKFIIDPKYFSLQHLTGIIYLAEFETGRFGCVNYHGKEFFKE